MSEHSKADDNDSRIRSYDEALRQTDREALATLAAAAFVAIFFWTAVFLLRDSETLAAGLPLWFWTAVVGGLVVSIMAVIWLVLRVFRHFSFDLRPDEAAAEAHEKNGEDAA